MNTHHSEIITISEIPKIKRQNLDLEARLNTLERSKKRSDIRLFVVVGLFCVFVLVGFHVYSGDGKALAAGPYALQFLKGDEIKLGYTWDLNDDQVLTVSFVNSEILDEDQIGAAKSAIFSTHTFEVDDILLHKGPKGQVSTYYEGWAGALDALDTENEIPMGFKFMDNDKNSDIIITFTDTKHSEGYSGYAKSLLDENAKEILRTYITIYDAKQLMPFQVETIVKHEMGHALGLGHSTDPDDLMYDEIVTPLPDISECNIGAISSMYDKNNNEKFVCEK